MDDTWMMVETKLRVLHGLPIATIFEGRHVGTAHVAWGHPRSPHVIITTLCVNAQEARAEVSIMVEENARDVPARSSRSATARQTIVRALEKLQSALQKSGIDRAITRPTAEG